MKQQKIVPIRHGANTCIYKVIDLHTDFLDFIGDNLHKEFLSDTTYLEYSNKCLSDFILHDENKKCHVKGTN